MNSERIGQCCEDADRVCKECGTKFCMKHFRQFSVEPTSSLCVDCAVVLKMAVIDTLLGIKK